MTTWAEIIQIKLNRIKEQNNLIKAKEAKKNSIKYLAKNFIYIGIFGLIVYFAFNSGNKDEVQFKIGQELNYKNGFGEIKLYQLGQRKLSKTEQSNNGFEFDTEQNLINTNNVSEKFFVKNETNLIGTILDSLMIKDKKWLKIQLNTKLFYLPINFDPDSEKFNIKLQVFKEKNEVSSLSKDFYVNLDEIKDLITANE